MLFTLFFFCSNSTADWQYGANEFVKQLPDHVIVHCKLCHFVLSITMLFSFTFFFASFSYFYEICSLFYLETDFTVKIANKIMLRCADERIVSSFATLY
jgi:hypothetical protein